jgi:hypothetical protein
LDECANALTECANVEFDCLNELGEDGAGADGVCKQRANEECCPRMQELDDYTADGRRGNYCHK